MKLQDFVEQVKKSEGFKEFVSGSPDSYLCAGFFVIDYKLGNNEISIDYFDPASKNIMTFKFQDKITKVPLEPVKENYTPEKIQESTELEVEQLKAIILDEMHNRGMTYDLEKLIIIVQMLEGKMVWNCTALMSGMVLVKSHVEDESKSVLFMEKSSFFDFLKPVSLKPGESLQDALKNLEEKQKLQDPEKAEGEHEGWIG